MNNFRPQPTSPNYRLGSSPLSQGPSYNVDLDYDLPAFPLSEASSPFTPSPKRESSASTQSISSPNHDNIGQNSRRSSLSSGAGNQPRRTPQLVDLTDSPPLRQGRFMGTSNSTSQTSEDRFYPSQRSVQPSSLRQNDLEVAPSRSTVASTSTPRRHRLRRISSSSYSSLESSDMPPRRTSTDGRQSSRKRRRLNPSNAEPEPVHENSEPAQQGTTSLEPTAIEEVDLTLVTNPASLANALSKQREDAVKAQAQTNTVEEDGGRTMLTSYKCPICMDVLEDATSTVCGEYFMLLSSLTQLIHVSGHLFCHK